MNTEAPIIVREARDGDCRAIADLSYRLLRYERALYPEMGELSPWAGTESEIRKQMHRPDTRFFVAEKEGEIAGYVKAVRHGAVPGAIEKTARRLIDFILRRPRPNVQSMGGLIPGLFVREEERRTSIGQRLVEAAEDWLRAQGMPASHIHVLTANQIAREFWDARGYRPIMLGLQKKL